MKKILITALVLLLAGCADEEIESPNESAIEPEPEQVEKVEEIEEETPGVDEKEEKQDYASLKESIIERYDDTTPVEWGESVEGVLTEIDTNEKVVALTFDACNGTPDSYDEELIQFLIEEEIPATLFIAGQWIEAYEDEFLELASQPLFEIANHGHDHKPLSVTGESAYGIPGTGNVEEAFNEIVQNQLLIEELTGNTPLYFRSGTAYYDNVAVEMAQELGLSVINYNVLGDAGGTFNMSQIISTFETAEEGSIFLFHMNQPNGEIASGVREGVRLLKERGYNFVQLQEVDGNLK